MSQTKQASNTILLVEDDEFLLKMYLTKLLSEGFDVTTAQDGEEAYTLLLRYKPDLVILDIMLPKINGFDVLEALRNNDELADTKVMIFSNLSQEEDIARGETLGIKAYLTKANIQTKDLVRKINEILSGDL